jgi:hypothetical protein
MTLYTQKLQMIAAAATAYHGFKVTCSDTPSNGLMGEVIHPGDAKHAPMSETMLVGSYTFYGEDKAVAIVSDGEDYPIFQISFF